MAERVSGRAPAGAALAVFIIALAAYGRTLAPSVGPTDSGELTAAAWCLGVAHPPGFPLFVLLTHLFTWLPLGSIAVRTNAASAFFAAAACAITALATGEMLRLPRDVRSAAKPETRKPKKGAAPPPQPVAPQPFDDRVIAVVMLATGLLFTFSRTLWDFATVTEVYALNSALMAGIAFGMLRWARTREVRWMYAAALLFGLGLAVHHVTIGLGAFAIAVLITRVGGAAFWRSRTTIVAAALLAAGLLVYAYLPIAASRKPVINWGDPSTPRTFIDHVTGKQYRSYIRTSDEARSAQLGRWGGIVGRELGPSWLPLAILVAAGGIVALFFRQRTIFWYVVVMIAADAAWFAVYPVVNDAPAYAIPAFLGLLFGFAFAAASIADLPASPRGRVAAAAAFAALPLLAAFAHFSIRDRSRDFVPHDYAANMLASMRPNAFLLTGDWQVYSPLWYALEVEHARPDVIAIDPSFLLRPWYFAELRRRYPQLARESARELDALEAALPEYERAGMPPDDAAFNKRLDDAMMSLFEHHLQHGPIYVTAEIAARNNARDLDLKKRMLEKWDIVPRGLAVELAPGHAIRGDVRFVKLQTRGISDGTVEYDEDDVVPNEIAPEYRAMYVMTGRYLALQRKYDQALLAYREAIAVDPTNSATEREMRVVEAQMPR